MSHRLALNVSKTNFVIYRANKKLDHNVTIIMHKKALEQKDHVKYLGVLMNLSKFDPVLADDATICARYMDDIIRNIKRARIEGKLLEINNLHPNLKFTSEREVSGKIPFLDMLIINNRGNLSSTWYNKPTDTCSSPKEVQVVGLGEESIPTRCL